MLAHARFSDVHLHLAESFATLTELAQTASQDELRRLLPVMKLLTQAAQELTRPSHDRTGLEEQ